VKAIGIIRVSSPGQTDKYGPQGQRDDIEAKAGQLAWDLVDVWRFQESATDPENRAQFSRFLNDLVDLGSGGTIQGVLFGHPDRLGRDGPIAFFHYIYMLRQLGKLEIRFGQDDIDPADRHYEDDLFDAATSAHRDGIKIKRRLLKGRMDRARDGKLPSGARDVDLYGYRYNRETCKRELDPVTNPILLEIGDKCLAGVPLRHITKWLRDEHNLLKSPTSLRKLLRNPAIAGRTISRWPQSDGSVEEIPLPDVTPATFTWDEYQEIQRRLDENRANAHYIAKQRIHHYPLSGENRMLLCRACGSTYVGVYKTARNGNHIRYYRHRREEKCNLTWRGDLIARYLEREVWGRVQEFFADPEEAVNRLELEVTSPRAKQVLELELRHLDQQLELAKDEKDKLTRAWARGRLSEGAYDKDVSGIEANEAKWERERELKRRELAGLRSVDTESLLALARMVASGVAARNLEQYLRDHPTKMGIYSRGDSGEWVLDNSRAYNVIEAYFADPDTELGREVWEIRRKLLRDLGVKVRISGRDLAVAVGVPVAPAVYGQNSVRKWCSTSHTCSKPISSA
jgi:hypothetical protein